MSAKGTASFLRSKRDRWSALALVVNGTLLIAACGGDEGTVPLSMGTAGFPAVTAGTTGAGVAGTLATAGRGTTTGVAGATGIAGRAATTTGGAGAPSTGGAGATAGTAGATTGTAGAGTAGAAEAGAGGMAATAGAGGATTTPGTGESSCLDGITNYDTAGPFKFMAKTSGQVKMVVPMVPAGCKVPIVHLANGTGAACSSYQPVLERTASHGFIAVCYENTNTGAGTQGIMAYDAAMKDLPDLFVKKLGSTGHSQGGQAAFVVLQLAEAKYGLEEFTMAGLAMEPASGFGTQPSGGSWQSVYAKIKSPMFAFSGTADMLVSQGWVQQGYDALADTIEAYHWSAVGATHIPVPNDATMNVSIAWWRWKLLGDTKACEWFKKLPDGDKWNSVKEQNVKPCM
jgi:hypothetical protein